MNQTSATGTITEIVPTWMYQQHLPRSTRSRTQSGSSTEEQNTGCTIYTGTLEDTTTVKESAQTSKDTEKPQSNSSTALVSSTVQDTTKVVKPSRIHSTDTPSSHSDWTNTESDSSPRKRSHDDISLSSGTTSAYQKDAKVVKTSQQEAKACYVPIVEQSLGSKQSIQRATQSHADDTFKGPTPRGEGSILIKNLSTPLSVLGGAKQKKNVMPVINATSPTVLPNLRQQASKMKHFSQARDVNNANYQVNNMRFDREKGMCYIYGGDEYILKYQAIISLLKYTYWAGKMCRKCCEINAESDPRFVGDKYERDT